MIMSPYTGHSSHRDYTNELLNKTNKFMELAFGKAAKGASLVLCLCSKCANRRRENKVNMSKHLLRNGFTPDYTRWVHHGEAHRMREGVMRARLEDFDDAARVGAC
jgi:hypothetical protein